MNEIESLSSQVDKLTQSVGNWNTAIIVIMIFAALTATGLVMAQYRAIKQAQLLADTEAKLSKAKDRDKDIKISGALGKAEEANKRANELAVKAEELSKQNIISSLELEKERKNRLKLEARVAWRKITDTQQQDISSKLIPFQNIEARLEFMAGDLEGEYFAADIAEMLHKAKWFIPIKPGSILLFSNFGDKFIPNEKIKKTGITIDSSSHDVSRKAADALVDELNSIGFDAVNAGVTRNFDKKVRPIVYITVYSKPEHAHDETKIRQEK